MQAKWSAQESINSHPQLSATNSILKARDFRSEFHALDPLALINADEFAALLRITRAAFNFRLHVGKVPDPVIREHRCVRWRVADVRGWMAGMLPVPAQPNSTLGAHDSHSSGSRRGRRRKSDAQ
ncbi:putative DNA-binding transcriptional regulator AlpA [Paraburkholderia sp. MM5477-R1]